MLPFFIFFYLLLNKKIVLIGALDQDSQDEFVTHK